jgi:hypothetical protein
MFIFLKISQSPEQMVWFLFDNNNYTVLISYIQFQISEKIELSEDKKELQPYLMKVRVLEEYSLQI